MWGLQYHMSSINGSKGLTSGPGIQQQPKAALPSAEPDVFSKWLREGGTPSLGSASTPASEVDPFTALLWDLGDGQWDSRFPCGKDYSLRCRSQHPI